MPIEGFLLRVERSMARCDGMMPTYGEIGRIKFSVSPNATVIEDVDDLRNGGEATVAPTDISFDDGTQIFTNELTHEISFCFPDVNPTPPTVPPDMPNLVSPAAGATRLCLRPTLDWDAAANTEIYGVYWWILELPGVCGDRPAGANHACVAPPDTSYTLAESELLEYDKTYCWQVVAFNQMANDCLGEASRDPQEFSTSTDPLKATLDFRRGDVDGSGMVDITDPIKNLEFLFLGTFTPACLDAADTDDSGSIDVSDPLLNMNFQQTGGVSIPLPGTLNCGSDPTHDNDSMVGVDCELGCAVYPSPTGVACP
jgi:hypothetical protein